MFYTVIFDVATNMPYFRGDTGTTIHYDEDDQEWVMMNNDPENGVNGTASASILPMGTGAQMWQINKDICNRNTLDPFNALMTVWKLVTSFLHGDTFSITGTCELISLKMVHSMNFVSAKMHDPPKNFFFA